jgi:hypothetical protein
MREFMDEPEDESPEAGAEPLPVVCRALRTKTAFGTLVGHTPWQHGSSSTAVYWCLKTMTTCGPDERFVHPHQCCAGRACYQDPEE